jgi:hypothetical protein
MSGPLVWRQSLKEDLDQGEFQVMISPGLELVLCLLPWKSDKSFVVWGKYGDQD